MSNKFNNVGSGFTFVNFITGIMAIIVLFFASLIVKGEIADSLQESFNNDSNIAFFELLLYEGAFLIGFFVHGIRYAGFDYYRRLYENNSSRRTWFTKIIFYLFRNGTVVEECLDEKRCENISLDWIKKSAQPEFDVWIYAKKIANSNPNARIYQFYYHSEVFQCLDTVFFLGSFFTFFFTIINILIFALCLAFARIPVFAFCFTIVKIPMNCDTLKNPCLWVLILLFFSLSLFILHWLCKKNSKSFARRFFFDIQVNLDAMN